MLTCDFAFCVYQQNGLCILASVDINSAGSCDSAIIIDLPVEELRWRKMELTARLKSYEDEWKKKKT